MAKHSSSLLHSIRLKTALLFVMALSVVAGLSVVGIMNKQALAHTAVLATSHQPERYSELYFSNHVNLPASTPALKTHTVTFHITNHEGQVTNYKYIAIMTIDSQVTVLADSQVTLKNTRGTEITFSFSLPKSGVRAVISVALLGHNEHIDFRTHS